MIDPWLEIWSCVGPLQYGTFRRRILHRGTVGCNKTGTDRTMPYTNTLVEASCETIETVVRLPTIDLLLVTRSA